MKVFISADIEGITSTTVWEECDTSRTEYEKFAEQMTKEVVAACEGAIAAGAEEILVKDAHGPGRNIDITKLPENVKIIRGWSGHPYMMAQGVDNTFDAAMFIGYHGGASKGGNPLSHTLTGRPLYIKINGEVASEFMIYSYAAAYEGVPTVFLAGDKELCDDSTKLHPKLVTVPVKEGSGKSTVCLSPQKSLKLIKEKSKKALKQDLKDALITLPDKFEVEICFKDHTNAYKMSFYPGMKQINSNTIYFESDNYFEVLKMVNFVL